MPARPHYAMDMSIKIRKVASLASGKESTVENCGSWSWPNQGGEEKYSVSAKKLSVVVHSVSRQFTDTRHLHKLHSSANTHSADLLWLKYSQEML
jgi:hypothetical protein